VPPALWHKKGLVSLQRLESDIFAGLLRGNVARNEHSVRKLGVVITLLRLVPLLACIFYTTLVKYALCGNVDAVLLILGQCFVTGFVFFISVVLFLPRLAGPGRLCMFFSPRSKAPLRLCQKNEKKCRCGS